MALWLLFAVQVAQIFWLVWQELRLRRVEQISHMVLSAFAMNAAHTAMASLGPTLFGDAFKAARRRADEQVRTEASGARPSDGAALSGAPGAPPRAAGGES